MIAAIFAFQIHDPEYVSCKDQRTERWVACALAIYHVGPLFRALRRDYNKEGKEEPLSGQPRVHATFHLLCLVTLAGRSLDLFP